MILDATKKEIHKALLEAELEAVGIRLNCNKPSIYYKQKKTGGIKFTATCTLTKCDEKMVQRILQEYKIFNAEVLFREDASPDQFIDVIMGNCIYMPCLYVYNKIDQIPLVCFLSDNLWLCTFKSVNTPSTKNSQYNYLVHIMHNQI